MWRPHSNHPNVYIHRNLLLLLLLGPSMGKGLQTAGEEGQRDRAAAEAETATEGAAATAALWRQAMQQQ